MTGTIRWNLYGGATAFVLTLLVSVSRNVFGTTLLRSFYSFLFVFALIFIFRFVLHVILNGNGMQLAVEQEADDSSIRTTGSNVDLATPDDDSLQDMLKANFGHAEPDDDGTGFAPLKPPKLMSQSDLNPEELANALRRMSEE